MKIKLVILKMGDAKLNKEILNKSINTIVDDLEIIKNGVQGLSLIDNKKYGNNYETLAINTALLSEKTTCNIRKLIYTTTNLTPNNYLKEALMELDIKIVFKDDIYEIEVPTLLMKKGKDQSSDYVASPLARCLDNFVEENELRFGENLVVCFNQIYDENSPLRRVRDYDNIDLKRILDIVAIYFLDDDSGYYIDMFNTTTFGEKDMTKISIMDKKYFENWLKNN